MTTAAIIASLSIGALLGCLGPILARRLPPRHGTWLITIGAAIVALTAGAVLILVGATLLGQLSDLFGLAHWSAPILREDAPTEPGVAALSLAAAAASGVSLTLVAVRRGRSTWRAYRASPSGSGPPRLVVVEDLSAGAVAIPGRPGTITVSRSLLEALSPFERRVVLAHERAHLTAGHHWHRSVVAIAAAANPLLRPLIRAVEFTTERWADESAAAEVGDRTGAARALARVALITTDCGRARPELAIGGRPVAARVSALLDDAPAPRPLLTTATVAVLLLALVAALIVEKDVEHLFELAAQVHRTTSGYAGR